MRLLIAITTISLTVASPVLADWQSDLEAVFPHVYTFDNLADWTGVVARSGNAKSKIPSDLPKTSTGEDTLIVAYQFEGADGSQDGPWIGDHGEYSRGSKSLRASFTRMTGGTDAPDEMMGPADTLVYFGDINNPDSGYNVAHVFYMIKFQRDSIDLNSGNYSWEPSGTNDEYYLTLSGGDPGLLMPNYLIINGTWVDDPITLSTGNYDERDDSIGSLSADTWAYGDANSLGYETLYVKLSDSSDPDTKAAEYIMYDNGFFVQTADGVNSTGTLKHLLISQGFWYDPDTSPYLMYEDSTGGEACDGVFNSFYGINFSIMNWYHQSDYTDLLLKDNQSTATTPLWYETDSCYKYTYVSGSNNYGADLGVRDAYLNHEWIGIEYIFDKGTCGTANGSITVSYYSDTGTLLGTETRSDLLMCNNVSGNQDYPYNKISMGGNRFGTGYSYDVADSWDNRYYIDDLIISDSDIASAYFALASSAVINGSCGTADGQTYSTTPSTGLCSSGSATSVSLSGTTYSWTCSGINGGTSESCSATYEETAEPAIVCSDYASDETSCVSNGCNYCDGVCQSSSCASVGSKHPWRFGGVAQFKTE